METSTGPEPVTCRREADGLAVVTIDRPERRNALNLDVKRRLTTIVETLAGDPAVQVIILTGAQGVFVAGTDLAEMAGMTPPSTRSSRRIRSSPCCGAVRRS